MNTELVTFDFQSHAIPFTSDAHINLTVMCAAFKTSPSQFLRLEGTQRFMVALAADTGLSLESDVQNPHITSSLLTTLKGNFADGQQQGTWAHPDLALECARWLSPEFAIWTNRTIRRLLSGECLHSAQDVRALARMECRIKELNEDLRQLRRRMGRMTHVEGNVSVWAYLKAAGLHTLTLVERMNVANKAVRLCQVEGLPAGRMKQRQAMGKNLTNRVATFPPSILCRVLCALGFKHTEPPLKTILKLWQPMLPLQLNGGRAA